MRSNHGFTVFPDSLKKQAIELVKKGLTIDEAAKRIGAHYASVARWIKKERFDRILDEKLKKKK